MSLVRLGRRKRWTESLPSMPAHKYEESDEIERRSGLFPATTDTPAVPVVGFTDTIALGVDGSVDATETYSSPCAASQITSCGDTIPATDFTQAVGVGPGEIVKVRAAETPPLGAGFATVTLAVPAAEKSLAG